MAANQRRPFRGAPGKRSGRDRARSTAGALHPAKQKIIRAYNATRSNGCHEGQPEHVRGAVHRQPGIEAKNRADFAFCGVETRPWGSIYASLCEHWMRLRRLLKRPRILKNSFGTQCYFPNDPLRLDHNDASANRTCRSTQILLSRLAQQTIAEGSQPTHDNSMYA